MSCVSSQSLPVMQSRLSVCAGALLLLEVSLSAATFTVAQGDANATDDGPGTRERPWRTIAHATEKAQAGDRVEIRDGVYREQVVIKANGTAEHPLCFESAPGARVVLTGADRLTGWERAGSERPIFRIPWAHRFVPWSTHMTHPDDRFHRLIGRCEQVAVENYLLRQVLAADQMAPGTFFTDTSNQVLQVWDPANRDLNKIFVEGSARQEILRVEGAEVRVRGLHFRFAANMAQHGAVILAGAHDVLEDCVVENMNSAGATFLAPGQVVRRCMFRDNGQLGFGANGAHQLLFTECIVENNNIKGFDRGWEAGGNKLVLCRDAVLERSQFIRNRGHGLWFDIGNEYCTVRQCLIADNEDSGIFCEISYGLRADDNVIVGNGFAATAGAWGAQAGISLSSSPDAVIERNLILGNREGFNFREQMRTTPRIDKKTEEPVWNHDELVRRNIIAFNRDAQIWGWFDVADDRAWPAGGVTAKSGAAASAPGFSLRSLDLHFEQNLYFAAPGQGWFAWGPTWRRHQRYADLTAFQTELGIDSGSRAIDPGFIDLTARDYRLSRDGAEQFGQNYPHGPIPGAVTMGTLSSP